MAFVCLCMWSQKPPETCRFRDHKFRNTPGGAPHADPLVCVYIVTVVYIRFPLQQILYKILKILHYSPRPQFNNYCLPSS